MATSKNFEVKNGLSVGGTQRISSAGEFTGSLASATTATTQSASDNSTKIATTAYTDAAITALVDSSPSALNTLNELAAALGDDASFSTTVTNSIAAKLPLAGGTMTGDTRLNDSVKHKYGSGDYFQAYHDGSNAYLKNTAGWLNMPQGGSGVSIANSDFSKQLAKFVVNGAVELYHNGSAKLATTSTGVTATGNIISNASGGVATLGTSGHITSKQSLDTATAGGRLIGESNRGTVAMIQLEQQVTNADGGMIKLATAPSGSTSPTTKVLIDMDGNVGIGYTSLSSKLQVDGKGYFGPVGTGQGDTKANMQTNAVLQLKPHDSNSTNMTFAQVNGGAGIGIQVSNGPQTANWDIALNPFGGGVTVGGTSIISGVNLQVNGGKIYVPNHEVQAETALIGGHLNFKWKEQPLNNSATSPSANKSAAYIGSNSSSTGIVLQRDSAGNTFPDFAITENGYVYVSSNITMQNGGTDSADYRSGAPGYVNWGSKIENHGWKNWSGTGNYTARLYTPIVHNEGNMFQLEIDVYGYSTGGAAQRYIGGGYAYSGSSLIAQGTIALSGSLTHRLTTATHPNFSSTVVCFDIGYSNNNGTAYYNHMRWRYQGWNGKRAEDFVWAHVTT